MCDVTLYFIVSCIYIYYIILLLYSQPLLPPPISFWQPNYVSFGISRIRSMCIVYIQTRRNCQLKKCDDVKYGSMYTRDQGTTCLRKLHFSNTTQLSADIRVNRIILSHCGVIYLAKKRTYDILQSVVFIFVKKF